jgi:hypothetical protein
LGGGERGSARKRLFLSFSESTKKKSKVNKKLPRRLV